MSSSLFDSVIVSSDQSDKLETYDMDVICNNSQCALHCLSAQIQMSSPLFGGRCGHGYEAGKSVSIDDHLYQMFQLMISPTLQL
jgi:hypothetical protein